MQDGIRNKERGPEELVRTRVWDLRKRTSSTHSPNKAAIAKNTLSNQGSASVMKTVGKKRVLREEKCSSTTESLYYTQTRDSS